MELCEKKQKHCEQSAPEEAELGDQWDHIALYVPSRFVLSMVVGKRTSETLVALVADFAQRTGERPPRLVTTDDCATYEPVLLARYGEAVVVRRKDGEPDRRFRPYKVWPDGSAYATVKKSFKEGEVAEARQRLVLGTPEALRDALRQSRASTKINTSFVERQNGTDRTHNSRKVRKTLGFSKELLWHLATGWWVMFCYNFHFVHAGLSELIGFDAKRRRRRLARRTPAMAIGLANQPWSVAQILLTRLPNLPSPSRITSEYFQPWHEPACTAPRGAAQRCSCPTR